MLACFAVKLDFIGLERVARPAQPKWQQSRSLLLKFGLVDQCVGRESVCAVSLRGAGSSWSRAGGTEGPRVEACGDGTEGSPAVVAVGEARPLFVLLAVERLLDMEHEPALRCLERLRKRKEQVGKEGSPSLFVTA